MKDGKIIRIGEIGNYYGSLCVCKSEDKYFWAIENWDGHYWVEIPKSLFKTLVKYEKKRKENEFK